MTNRDQAVQAFLDSTHWAGAETAPLAGDASNRRYLRLHRQGESAVLMDAPTEKGEDVRPFMRVAGYLAGLGLSAPRILAADEAGGFLILEDLGDALYARVLQRERALEETLYTAATDLLVHAHRSEPLPDLADYAPGFMADMAALAFDWYLKALTGGDQAARRRFHDTMRHALETHAPQADVLIQRDYHAENLLWLPERQGIARVGLLDFQDARRGHRAYDLVSLLQDARRDVPPDLETRMIRHYIAAASQGAEEFTTAYHVLGAQRNLRIIGVFARLCLTSGKAHYIDLIPRVWAYLQRDLAHPALKEVADTLQGILPSPGPEVLSKLKAQCASPPNP